MPTVEPDEHGTVGYGYCRQEAVLGVRAIAMRAAVLEPGRAGVDGTRDRDVVGVRGFAAANQPVSDELLRVDRYHGREVRPVHEPAGTRRHGLTATPAVIRVTGKLQSMAVPGRFHPAQQSQPAMRSQMGQSGTGTCCVRDFAEFECRGALVG